MTMKVVLLTALLGAAGASACSLFIPFDEYPGSTDAGSSVDASQEDASLGDASDLDAGEDAKAICKGIDTKTDPKNCGACGRACVIGGCDAGRCDIDEVSPGLDAGSVLSLYADPLDDAGTMLYVTRTSGHVGRVLLDTAPEERMPLASPLATGGVAITNNGQTGIYAGADTIGSFKTATFTIAAPEVILTRTGLGPLAVELNTIFFGDPSGMNWTQAKADASVFSTPTVAPVAITSQANTLYWTSADGDVYSMQSRSPANAALIINAGRPGVTSLAVAKSRLYLGQKSQGLILYDFDGISASNPKKVALDDVEALTTDNAHIYVVDYIGGARSRARVLRTNLDGTAVIVLADGLLGAKTIAVTGSYVYFGDGRRILRTTK